MVADSEGADVATQNEAVDAAARHIDANAAAILSEFLQFVGLPNVSADLDDVEAVAGDIAEKLQDRGIAARLIRRPGAAPLVTGRIEADPGRPTIGIYAHYDGQPVDQAGWETPPFSGVVKAGGSTVEDPTEKPSIDPDWRVYARSTSDDKAPVQAALSALDALSGSGISPTVNVVFLFEGQEEAGSPDLEEYLVENAQWFSADMWLICDGPIHQSGAPQIIFGVRGIAQVDITVLGPLRGLHSGHYGNWVPNPAWTLVQLLSTMRSPEGTAMIEGFYDDVVPPSEAEIEAIKAIPDYEAELLVEFGVHSPEGSSESLVERMYRPSLNIRGFDAGPVGEQAANVLPASATVSLDIRLPPGHDADVMIDRVVHHIEREGFSVFATTPSADERRMHERIAVMKREPHYTGMRVPIDGPVGDAILQAAAAASETGEVVAMPTLGGSVPIIHFDRVLGVPTVIVPMANHDNNQHDANENIRIGNLWYGIRLMAALMTMPPTVDVGSGTAGRGPEVSGG
jgi:acetylornithine deacetylase/succinyl-diaminopimelate desuccinylase-like protein